MSDDGLICVGGRPIAKFIGATVAQVYYWNRLGLLPCFRVGETLCADKATLRAWIVERQSRARTDPEPSPPATPVMSASRRGRKPAATVQRQVAA